VCLLNSALGQPEVSAAAYPGKDTLGHNLSGRFVLNPLLLSDFTANIALWPPARHIEADTIMAGRQQAMSTLGANGDCMSLV